MTGDENHSEHSEPTGPAGELRLSERAVSRGVAIGRVVCLYGDNRQFYRVEIVPGGVDREIERLHYAFETARRQLSKLAARKVSSFTASTPPIFESQKLMIEDPAFLTQIEEEIHGRQTNSEWAIKQIADRYAAKFKAIEDERLRDRYIDIYDVSERIIDALKGSSVAPLPFARDAIVAAKELRPSTLLELSAQGVIGIITENGGWTSHTFILAREMNLPGVTGVGKLFRKIKTGDKVVVDGFSGDVIVNPSDATLAAYSKARLPPKAAEKPIAADHPPTKTLDGQRIIIYANADSPAAYLKAKDLGAEGIGLYRSEFLLGRSQKVPGVSSQVAAYSAIAAAAGDDGVKIRTFDLEVERLIDERSARERNPALGLRAVRLGLTKPKLLRDQLRAILLASAGRKVDVVVPMISGVSELRSVRSILESEADSLKVKGRETGKPNLGSMIEIPSAVFMIDEILAEADFVCLGTNDLIQYLLAADRDNESVAGWYRTLHPGVLRAIGKVLGAASKAGKPAIVCGEMAGSPYYVPVLVGMGATALSMNRSSILAVRNVVSGIALEEARALVAEILRFETVEEIESKLAELVRSNWLHLFPAGFLK